MKKYLFNQPAGLGDIMFLMAIAQKYYRENYKIIWPIDAVYGDYSYNFPEVKFISEKQFFAYQYYDNKHFIFEDDEYISLPFRWADVILNKGVNNVPDMLKDKYRLVNLPMDMWRTFTIIRNTQKEDALFNLLDLKENEEFNLINENQTRIYQKTKIEVNNGLRNVYMSEISGYNLLDWLKVMYKAKTIHTVATSLLILIERLDDLPALEKHIYRRIWDSDHSNYDYLLDQIYTLH